MTAPERIYLQGAADAPDCEDPNSGVTWCWHQIDDTDVEYVRADIAARATAEQSKPCAHEIIFSHRINSGELIYACKKHDCDFEIEVAPPQAPQKDVEQRDSVIEECAAVCHEAENGFKTMDRKQTASYLAAMIRALKSQQDAAIESKPAEQRSLGDVTGAMYRCRRCGETSEIQFNFATVPKEDSCCRQQPCVRPGKGPCDMPAPDTKLSATHQSLLVRLAALKRYRNKLKSTGEPSGNYATLSVPIALLEDIDAAIESQRSGDGS